MRLLVIMIGAEDDGDSEQKHGHTLERQQTRESLKFLIREERLERKAPEGIA